MSNIFTFKTPDNKFIHLIKLTLNEKNNLLANNPKQDKVPILDTIHNPAYLLPDGKILHELTFNNYAHLFDNIEDYKNFIKGENFYDSVVLYKNNYGYASFGIKPSKISNFLKAEHRIDTSYEDKEGYKVYLFEEGSVCFVKNTSQKAKRAFWFENKASFEYYFYHVFDN